MKFEHIIITMLALLAVIAVVVAVLPSDADATESCQQDLVLIGRHFYPLGNCD